jgi:MHS family proline/betaine transporter-like MFS transporter
MLDAQLLAYATFGAGFLMRPLGSILFGIYGDRWGRRNALAAVTFIMAIATFTIGLLPTYETAGIIAPVMLIVIRLAQGLSAGGEWGGSTAYIVEFTATGRRGFLGSWQQVSVAGGLLLGSGIAKLLDWDGVMTHDTLIAWGWRIPFLLGILVGGVGVYMRWRLDDTPKFREVAQKGEIAKAPLIDALTTHRRATFNGFGITLHNTVAYYVVLAYMVTFLTSVGKIAQSDALTINVIGLIVFIILIPFAGALSDRVGRKPLLMGSCIGYILLTFPLMWMAANTSVALALVAQIILVAMLALYAGPGPATYAEIFPTQVRYTALSIGYNTAVAIFGGFAPFLATYLIKLTGYSLAPTFYLIAASTITLLVLWPMKETAFTPLR